MGEQVKTLTNYGPFVRNRGALALSDKDKETVDLLFEISKNEGERHGKMPTFGSNGKPVIPVEEKKPAASEKVAEKPAEVPVKKPAVQKPADVNEDVVKVVE